MAPPVASMAVRNWRAKQGLKADDLQAGVVVLITMPYMPSIGGILGEHYKKAAPTLQ